MTVYNPLTLIDGYKYSHRQQYPEGTTRVYSNWTPRSSRVVGQDKVVFFGLQYFLKKYLMDDLWRFLTGIDLAKCIQRYQRRIDMYLGPECGVGTKHIRDLFDLGYIPLEFRALPEGTLCPLRVPMFTVENTHPDFAWVTNYYETILSNVVWMPCTSATSAYRMRKLLNNACERTGGNKDFIKFQGHDFSMRGMAGLEAAAMSGAAHLLSFVGTDTVPAIDFIEEYYEGHKSPLLGCSVPATEHSVMSCGGELSEEETFDRLLTLYPNGIVSIVSDTWNIWDVLTKIFPKLKNKILQRVGKLVTRPDSGDPVKIICGYDSCQIIVGDNIDPRAIKGVVELLWDVFGGTVNEKRFKELNPKVGVIYGDSINYERCKAICDGLERKGFASTNIVFGIGSYTYQYVTRDTYGFAMKATWAEVNGEGRNLFKKPVTDDGMKFSATGRLAVAKNNDGELYVIEKATPEQEAQSLLEPVWKDGKFLRTQSFENIRQTLAIQE